MNSSLSLGSIPAKRTEVAAQSAPYFSHFTETFYKSIETIFLSVTVNPKPPGMRTHLRWVKASPSSSPPSSSYTHIRQLILLFLSLLMTTTELLWTGSDAGFECVLFVFSAQQGPASCRLCDLWPFQCGMFWMCVRRRDLPTHTRTHTHTLGDSVFHQIYLSWHEHFSL